MPVVFCGVSPHPPIMVPEVGGKQSDIVIKSRQAMLELGKRLKDSGADVLVMITPHGPVFRDGIAINAGRDLRGDLARFGAADVSFEFDADLDLAGAIHQSAGEAGITTLMMGRDEAERYGVNLELDHGLVVPLYFLAAAGVDIPLVVLYMGMLPYHQLYNFGIAVREAVDRKGRRAAVIASGDMSHCLTSDAPAGYSPRGREFDLEMVRLLGQADVEGIMDLDPDLVEKAGECGLRPVTIMLGTLDGLAVKPEVISYEGPFGVGYLVASLIPEAPDASREFGRSIDERRRARVRRKKDGEGFLPSIARAALEAYSEGKRLEVPPGEAPPEFRRPAGVFVSLKKDGRLRGCIGTISPRYGSIIEETLHNAISAGHRDPRFDPVSSDELDDLDISVDVLESPEPVKGIEDLDPVRYGVIVKSGRRQGLLLPNLEGVDTVEEQIAIARQKAGISPGEKIEIERFEVKRYK
ncbi:MAG: AmmeMemoRadiSam system protein A [Bacillota bacterium]